MKKVKDKIKKYKSIKADITNIDIRLQELEEEILGVTSMENGERTSKTSKQYPFYVFSAYADKRTSEKSSFQLGADVFLMEYVKEHLYFLSVAYPEGNEDATSIDYKRVGVFGGYEIHFSKLSIEGQMGVYVYAPFSAEEAVYQRLSSKYLITDHIFAGLGLKTHMAKAEALEFSIGYSF